MILKMKGRSRFLHHIIISNIDGRHSEINCGVQRTEEIIFTEDAKRIECIECSRNYKKKTASFIM